MWMKWMENDDFIDKLAKLAVKLVEWTIKISFFPENWTQFCSNQFKNNDLINNLIELNPFCQFIWLNCWLKLSFFQILTDYKRIWLNSDQINRKWQFNRLINEVESVLTLSLIELSIKIFVFQYLWEKNGFFRLKFHRKWRIHWHSSGI